MKIKLESLKSDKFESLKENEFSALSKCLGGQWVSSSWSDSAGNCGDDEVDNESDNFSSDYVKCAFAPQG